jgi:hypothetical protein
VYELCRPEITEITEITEIEEKEATEGAEEKSNTETRRHGENELITW